jgi:hypothetical protein
MCRMCEGFSLEDVLALDAAAIREYGFTVIGVGGPDDPVGAIPWSYTVGLVDAAGHPELIVAGLKLERGAHLVSRVARRILAGQRLGPDGRVKVDRGMARVGSVHPIQYELGTFNFWHNLRAVGALESPHLEALQIFAPSSWFCSRHQHSQPDLSDPNARIESEAA